MQATLPALSRDAGAWLAAAGDGGSDARPAAEGADGAARAGAIPAPGPVRHDQ